MCCFLLLRLTYKNIAGNKFSPSRGRFARWQFKPKTIPSRHVCHCFPLKKHDKHLFWQSTAGDWRSYWQKGPMASQSCCDVAWTLGQLFRTTSSFQISSWVKVIHKRSIVKCWPASEETRKQLTRSIFFSFNKFMASEKKNEPIVERKRRNKVGPRSTKSLY